MTIDIIQTADIIESLENFLHKKRPPLGMKSHLDLTYKIDNQSVIIFETRPVWNNPQETLNSNVAKATYIKAKDQWDVYWMRSDLKWHRYQPTPHVKTVKEFVALVDKDEHCCFWG